MIPAPCRKRRVALHGTEMISPLKRPKLRVSLSRAFSPQMELYPFAVANKNTSEWKREFSSRRIPSIELSNAGYRFRIPSPEAAINSLCSPRFLLV